MSNHRARRAVCSVLGAALALLAHGLAMAVTTSSPDGRLQVEIDRRDLGASVGRYPAGEAWYMRATRDGATVLDWSPLGLRLAGADLRLGLDLVGQTTESVEGDYTLLHGKRRAMSYAANETVLSLAPTSGPGLEVVLRVFDDGFAVRYRLDGSGPVTVDAEHTAFRIPSGAIAYLSDALFPDLFFPSFEAPYVPRVVGTNGPGDGFYYPALFALGDGQTFVLLHEAGLDEHYVGTRLDADATDRVYQVRFPSPGEGDPAAPTTVVDARPLATPWRVVMVGTLSTLVASDLVTHLGSDLHPAFGGDTSWIRPGKAAWSWWSQDTGLPPLQREYVDSAYEFGWQHIVVDAGWAGWPDADAEVEALAEYAATRGIGVFLWYNSGGPNNAISEVPRDRLNDLAAMRAELARLRTMGVAGVKVDFFRGDKQANIRQYRELLRAAAENRLMVVFHGSTPPRGWRREFPNLLTSESVIGTEWYKSQFWDAPKAIHNVALPFIRNVVGAMDYTPLAFESALALHGITYGHQIALPVVYESAMQTFADRADASPSEGFRALFARFPYLRELLRELPTTWDETRLLEGHPSSHAVLARRSGGRWYIGGINGNDVAVAVSVAVSQFPAAVYDAHLVADGTTPDDLTESTVVAGSETVVNVTMAPRGGFLLALVPRSEHSPFRDDPREGEWRVSPWMGHLDDQLYPWVNHREHGWFRALTDDASSFVTQSEADGIRWTSETLYPLMYDYARGQWLYYIVDSADPRVFFYYDTTLGRWLPLPPP